MSLRYQAGILGAGFNPLQAPNAPTIGAATAANQTVSVAFTAPTNVGGSAITSYAVRVSPGGFSASGTSSPISVTGLTNDVAYTFSVAALNSYGPSPYSGTVTATPSFLAVEDVFSTWLYTGNGSTQTITNGIDLAGKGGMVWFKSRSSASSHELYDTNRGITYLRSDSTGQAFNGGVTSYNSNGISFDAYSSNMNNSGVTYVSWTFRKAPKFFDVVTYTGNGVSGRSIAHNLGSAPGCIMIKGTSNTDNWSVYHRSLTVNSGVPTNLYLNTTNGESAGGNFTAVPTSTEFFVGPYANNNANGITYVAYLFAHDTTSDGIIQCGSFTTDGSANGSVNLGWEPQWVLVKPASNTGSWQLVDAMRGMTADKLASQVLPNTNTAEQSLSDLVGITSTGFTVGANGPGLNMTVIYIAIRRGPMRTPTSGTSVFNAQANLSTDANKITTGFVTDWFWERGTYNATNDFQCSQRLTQTALVFNSTAAQGGPYGSPYLMFDYNDGFLSNLSGNINPGLMYGFRRAPSFFDVVCYIGTGSVAAINHNLGVVPELIIVKRRSGISNWITYDAANGATKVMYLNLTNASASNSIFWNNTAPTSSQFTVGNSTEGNGSGSTYVAYLFASCPGVSKVGSYTGNGSSQTINCGFAAGARFVMIKRTDAAGDWYVWDTARGIVSGNDPHLSLNTNVAQVTTDDSVDTDSSGFVVNQLSATNINVSSASYIFLAIS